MIDLKTPFDILRERDLAVLDQARSIISGGIPETEGIALKIAISKILESQVSLAYMIGNINYTIAILKRDQSDLWYTIYNQYKDSVRNKTELESIIETDSEYSARKRDIAALEAVAIVANELNWIMKSQLKLCQI